MPLIRIKSLPLDRDVEIGRVVEGITEDFAARTGVGLAHVTATWEFLQPGSYAVGGKRAFQQPQASHPILVDLLVPDFNAKEKLQQMLQAVASSISDRTSVPVNNIFIDCRYAHSGMVFDAGEIVQW